MDFQEGRKIMESFRKFQRVNLKSTGNSGDQLQKVSIFNWEVQFPSEKAFYTVSCGILSFLDNEPEEDKEMEKIYFALLITFIVLFVGENIFLLVRFCMKGLPPSRTNSVEVEMMKK